jgi:hypothetical protein
MISKAIKVIEVFGGYAVSLPPFTIRNPEELLARGGYAIEAFSEESVCVYYLLRLLYLVRVRYPQRQLRLKMMISAWQSDGVVLQNCRKRAKAAYR